MPRPKETHEFVAFRLPDGEERTADQLFELPPDELSAFFAGMPDVVLAARPGGDSFVAFGDGTLTRPGRYLIFCAVPTGANPDEYARALKESQDGPPNVAGGPRHYTHGMFGEVRVG